jgi:hypothetical protein
VREIAKSGTISGEGVGRRRKTLRRREALSAFGRLRLHWPDYLMEAGELALFIVSAVSRSGAYGIGDGCDGNRDCDDAVGQNSREAISIRQ